MESIKSLEMSNELLLEPLPPTGSWAQGREGPLEPRWPSGIACFDLSPTGRLTGRLKFGAPRPGRPPSCSICRFCQLRKPQPTSAGRGGGTMRAKEFCLFNKVFEMRLFD